MAEFITRLSLAVPLAAAVAALSLWQPAASAAPPREPADTGVLQVFADVVLIEAQCRTLNADYGKLFAYAERNGLRPVDVMPLGERRAAFEAAYRRRAREMKPDRLCGELAAERDATVPGVFTPR